MNTQTAGPPQSPLIYPAPIYVPNTEGYTLRVGDEVTLEFERQAKEGYLPVMEYLNTKTSLWMNFGGPDTPPRGYSLYITPESGRTCVANTGRKTAIIRVRLWKAPNVLTPCEEKREATVPELILLTADNVEEAKRYLGRSGMFTDTYQTALFTLRTPERFGTDGTLISVDHRSSYPFIKSVSAAFAYQFFVTEKLKDPEYVPFTWEDRDLLKGRWVRYKDSRINIHAIIMIGEDLIQIQTYNGANGFNYMSAFEDLLFDDGTPFGKLKS